MAKGLHDTWDGLRDALDGINGSTGGYWHDFSGAVLEKTVLPEEMPGLPPIYLCVPFDDVSESFEEQDQHAVKSVTNFVVLVFARDSKEDPTATETIKFLSRVRDDVMRLVLTDHTLGGTVWTSRLVSANHVGANEAGEYGVSEIIIAVTQLADLGDIGSAA